MTRKIESAERIADKMKATSEYVRQQQAALERISTLRAARLNRDRQLPPAKTGRK
jgi:hypothetical protein